MHKNMQQYVTALPLVGLFAAYLGALYNFVVVSSFGDDLFYALSYQDHLQSAILAFGLIIITTLVFEIVVVMLLKQSSWFHLPLSNRSIFLFLCVSIAVMAAISGTRIGGVENLRSGFGFLFPFVGVVYLRRAILNNDFVALALSFIVLSAFAISGGIIWNWSATAETQPKYRIITDRSNIFVKAIKPFKDFSFLIDADGKRLVVRSSDIHLIQRQ